MLLHLFRFSLTERREESLFDKADVRFEYLPRKEWLHKWFSSQLTLDGSRNRKFSYKTTQIDGDIISGVLARWESETIEGDPHDPFKIVEGGHWEKSSFFFNVGNDEQVFGIEYNVNVGKPSALVKLLTKKINETTGQNGYKVDAFSMNIENNFWSEISKHPGSITSLTFDLVIPNPIDGEGATKKGLMKLRRKFNGDHYKSTLSNSEGLKLDHPIIRDAEAYSAKGGGDTIAKDGKNIVYDSRKSGKTIEVDDDFKPTGQPITGLSDEVAGKLKR